TAPREIVKDPPALARRIERTGSTILQGPPPLWHALTTTGVEGRQGLTMLVGGEPLTDRLSLALRGLGGRVTNLYGPTETTIWSAVMALDDDDAQTPPLGRPIWNTRVYVLDGCLGPVPVGVVGELCIAGAGGGGGLRVGGLWRTGMGLREGGCTAAGTWRAGAGMGFWSLWGARTIRLRFAASGLSLGRSRQRWCGMTACRRRRLLRGRIGRGASSLSAMLFWRLGRMRMRRRCVRMLGRAYPATWCRHRSLFLIVFR